MLQINSLIIDDFIFVLKHSMVNSACTQGSHRRSRIYETIAPILKPSSTIIVAARVMREKFMPFLLIVGAAKTLRYVFIAGLFADLL